MTSGNKLKLGAILSYASIILTSIIGILLTPFIVHTLGQSEFGLYVLIGSFISYLTVLDFGLNNTIVRFIANYRALNDKRGEEDFLGTVMLVYLIISLFVVVLGWVIFLNFDVVFSRSLTSDELSRAKIMFVILVFNMAITLPGGSFGAICNGYEEFVTPRVIGLVKYALRSLTVVAILWMGGKAIAIVVIDTIVNVAAIFANGYYATRLVNFRLRFTKIDASLLRTVVSYSVWIFILTIVGLSQWRVGQVVLGVLSGTNPVAVYGIGVILGTYYGGFSTSISGLFLPRAARMVADSSSTEELTSMMIKIGRVSLIVLLYVLGAFILFGKDFIHLWIGDGFQESWFVALLIMIGYTVPLVQHFANSILEARALLAFKALLYLSMTIIGAILGAALVESYGVAGMVVGLTLAWMCSQVIMNVFFRRVLKLNIARFFKELLAGLSVPFLTIMAVCGYLSFDSRVSWAYLILNVTVYSTMYAVLMFFFGMNEYEKKMLVDPLRRMRFDKSGIGLSSNRRDS